MHRLLRQKLLDRSVRVDEWLDSLGTSPPLYMSADIRDAEFKIASIDANLYPAGFNNLHADFHPLARQHMNANLAGQGIAPGSRLLLVGEEHTRNLFYLENIRALRQILTDAGYSVDCTTQFRLEEANYAGNSVVLKTASAAELNFLDPDFASRQLRDYAAIIMNHDSSAGSAQWIQESAIPVLPPWQAGWHRRSKARHFAHYRQLMTELAGIVGIDPWFLSPLDRAITGIDINADQDRAGVAAQAESLLKEIQAKYDEYQIREKPFVFLKSDHGTYGMAMLSFDASGEILEINRKEKNKLFKGKSSVIVKDYLLQEGIPTTMRNGDHFAESVIMLANNQFIGKFARVNEQKGNRVSLNSTGMYFQQMAPADCEDEATRAATMITRVAGIALQREISELASHGATGPLNTKPA